MTALEYHESTKHYFNRFARSAGHLDWATQPDPFRRFTDASTLTLPRGIVAADVPYDSLYDQSAPSLSISAGTVSEFLRCAMGLSAWKQHQTSRWALRVNPSSGNLHPTETYIVWEGSVYHYAPREHLLEQRCVLDGLGSDDAGRGLLPPAFLVGLTSIFWREAWKYGERAFRYCQHDLGHALGALRLSAARLGWQMQLLTDWSDVDVGTLLGVDREEDFGGAEREEPECLVVVHAGAKAPAHDCHDGYAGTEDPACEAVDPTGRARLLERARRGIWRGRANRLSPSRVEWNAIDAVAEATRYGGGGSRASKTEVGWGLSPGKTDLDRGFSGKSDVGWGFSPGGSSARTIILQRRSAVAFDGRSALPAQVFMRMLSRLRPEHPPWDVVAWPPHVHLALFVHRVDGLLPGIYAFLRDASVASEWRAAMRPQFVWEPQRDPAGHLREGELYLLLPFDMTWPAMRVSCDQDIAGDGFFSLGMIGRTGSIHDTSRAWFYRRLFWETGVIGQVLYLEAEAAGARATGIGCFYDDAVHELLGLNTALASQQVGLQPSPTSPSGEDAEFDARRSEWQSLYHFSMGHPVDDGRLTTEPGYEWEEHQPRSAALRSLS
jgi:SagB-type dehydrogenase family enzyme